MSERSEVVSVIPRIYCFIIYYLSRSWYCCTRLVNRCCRWINEREL